MIKLIDVVSIELTKGKEVNRNLKVALKTINFLFDKNFVEVEVKEKGFSKDKVVLKFKGVVIKINKTLLFIFFLVVFLVVKIFKEIVVFDLLFFF